jgi:hypothetical protein
MTNEPIIAIMADGQVVPGIDYNTGQLLEALELGRRAVLGIVPRPKPQPQPEPRLESQP